MLRKGKKRNLSFSPAPNVGGSSKVRSPSAATVLAFPETERVDLAIVKIQGHVDYFGASSISGWAYYVGHLDTPATLEFYFDNVQVGSVLASDYRPDLEKGGHGHGRHGFRFKPPTGRFDAAKVITVRASSGQTIGSLEK